MLPTAHIPLHCSSVRGTVHASCLRAPAVPAVPTTAAVVPRPRPRPPLSAAAAAAAPHHARQPLRRGAAVLVRSGVPGGDEQQQHAPAAPWSLTFDLRERETEWTDANKARLVALVAARELSIPMSDMDARLDGLVKLLPDLASSLPLLHPSLLAGLAEDLQRTTSRLLALRELLPDANVSRLVAARPQLLLQEPAELQAAVAALQQLLGLQRVDRLVQEQPLLLVTQCVEEVLADISRLMPHADAAALLVSDPGWLLRVQRGQRWLGLHPDSQLGEQMEGWKPGMGDG